jgi:hypothetical protein
MKLSGSKILLYIEPTRSASQAPVNDEFTLKVAFQMMNFTHKGVVMDEETFFTGLSTKGVHLCTGCRSENVSSRSYDILLPCGLATNTLALHYLQYHREEIPVEEMKKIMSIPPAGDFSLSNYHEKAL